MRACVAGPQGDLPSWLLLAPFTKKALFSPLYLRMSANGSLCSVLPFRSRREVTEVLDTRSHTNPTSPVVSWLRKTMQAQSPFGLGTWGCHPPHPPT